jgi:hypothetical protein
MAIGSMHIEWLSTLALRSQFPAGGSVIDLGPQDLWIKREPLTRVAQRHLQEPDCTKTLDAIFDGDATRPDSQNAFYSIFGGGSYHSLDLTDPRADFALDLNNPLPPGIGSYDVVTNFGTTEHVFNIGQGFANMHQLAKVGGILLHAIPSYSYIDHGFYNIHPSAFLDMAHANKYELVDVLYIDNINVRMARPIEAKPFDFGTLPIKLGDMTDTVPLMTKAALLFHDNLRSMETQKALAAMVPQDSLKTPIKMPDARLPIFIVFDLMFVAFRRTSADEFVAPIQGAYIEAHKRAAEAAAAAAGVAVAPPIALADGAAATAPAWRKAARYIRNRLR